MGLARDLSEFFAGLTWPLRGRKVVMEVENQVRQELHALRWEELHAVRCAIAEVRNEISAARSEFAEIHSEHMHLREMLGGEIASLAHQMDVLRQSLDSGLLASERLMRGNLSYTHDRIAALQESERALEQKLSAVFNQIARLQKTEEPAL